MLETLVTEIEALLNDRLLTYVSTDVQDTEPLTPANPLYGRKIITLPYEQVEDDELEDLTFGEDSQIKNRAKLPALALKHFRHRWKHEYLTALREFHEASGNNNGNINVGEIVLIYDDVPRINWRLVMIEELITYNDGLIHAAKLQTARQTNTPIMRLYPLEVMADPRNVEEDVVKDKESETIDGAEKKGESDLAWTSTTTRAPVRNSANRSKEQMMKWSKILCTSPRGC